MYQSIRDETLGFIGDHHEFRSELPWQTSWISITTITFTGKMDSEIDLARVNAYFSSERWIGTDARSFRVEMKRTDTDFFNQVTLKYNDEFSTKSIKLFTNGSVQVAGATDLFDCWRIYNHVKSIVSSATGKAYSLVTPFKVAMINTNFNLNFHVNLRVIQEIFKPVCRVAFDPDRYSAVKLKFKPRADMKTITASVFGTGKVIVTGAVKLEEIAHSYRFLTAVIRENLGRVVVGETRDNAGGEMFMGATYPQWIQGMKKISV